MEIVREGKREKEEGEGVWRERGEGEREEGREECSNSLHYGGGLYHLVYTEP